MKVRFTAKSGDRKITGTGEIFSDFGESFWRLMNRIGDEMFGKKGETAQYRSPKKCGNGYCYFMQWGDVESPDWNESKDIKFVVFM